MFWVIVFGGLLNINNKTRDKSAGIVFQYFHAGFEVFFKDFVAPHGSAASKHMWSSYFLVTLRIVRPLAGIRLSKALFPETYQNITDLCCKSIKLSFCQTVMIPKM